ncbi:MaoC/PaaZ C-terminal domain-containing protein [Rhodococcus sp. IEGM1428]|uniref:MaoC/PaaZ C-terminal domain-containing protein n=1 Tax=Rhodococcus sp. IEGM1428 TaxID=3392191 RepID=UPI003D10BD02
MTTVAADTWVGHELGTRTVSWNERDAMLFALAVGARTDQLDLVYERDLRVLPTFGLTLAQWAPDLLGAANAFDVGRALHAAQRLVVHEPIPPRGEVLMAARVAAVWDKGSAALFEVDVECEFFTATWSIFAPGQGGFGGERGPSATRADKAGPVQRRRSTVAANAALLYRLSGDRHAIHVDPVAARAIGQPRPILHGLATLATAASVVADLLGAHPCDVVELSGRFTSVVFPGESIDIVAGPNDRFWVETERGIAIDHGLARFRAPDH